MRTVQEIKDDVDRHEKEFPKHGVNCICMDTYIREMRVILDNRYGSLYNSRWEYVVWASAKFR